GAKQRAIFDVESTEPLVAIQRLEPLCEFIARCLRKIDQLPVRVQLLADHLERPFHPRATAKRRAEGFMTLYDKGKGRFQPFRVECSGQMEGRLAYGKATARLRAPDAGLLRREAKSGHWWRSHRQFSILAGCVGETGCFGFKEWIGARPWQSATDAGRRSRKQ